MDDHHEQAGNRRGRWIHEACSGGDWWGGINSLSSYHLCILSPKKPNSHPPSLNDLTTSTEPTKACFSLQFAVCSLPAPCQSLQMARKAGGDSGGAQVQDGCFECSLLPNSSCMEHGWCGLDSSLAVPSSYRPSKKEDSTVILHSHWY